MKNFDLNSFSHQEILGDSEMKEIVGGSTLDAMVSAFKTLSGSTGESSSSTASGSFEGATGSGSTISGSQGG